MNTLSNGLLVLALVAAAAAPAPAQARERGVHSRQQAMEHRIHQSWRHGDLARGEARWPGRIARDIGHRERVLRAEGHSTRGEHHLLHRDLDRLGREIHHERRSGEPRPRALAGGHGSWHGPFWIHRWHARDLRVHRSGAFADERRGFAHGRPAIGWDPRIDAIQRRQHHRIVQGVRSGALTREEARALLAEQRAIHAQERLYRSDGVLTHAERSELYQDLYAAGQHIYNEAHDFERR
ncbi:MAG TPA: hypothetical protein VNK67_02645 [Burkholderiales bacterium]|nr:hypothetical protein [Burkholderiales bacterium]